MTTLSRRFQRPFWPVSLVTGILALITLVILLVVYGQTHEWQYLALSGLGSTILLAHGLAWRLARASGRCDLAIWLIAASQILVSVLAPLFMADFWIIGLFLLVGVPIELGVADQPRRMPIFAIVTSLAAAGMVATDLLDVPGRLKILVELPGAVFLSLGLLILHGSGLSFLLWRLRLRSKATYYTRLDLATQLSLVFTGISAVSILVVTSVLIAQLRASQIAQVGQNFQTLAEMDAERVGNSLEQQINALASLSRNETALVEGVTVANAGYPASEVETRRLLEERELRWQNSPEGSAFVLRYRSSPQTLALSKFRGVNTFHNNIFVTDRLGGLVAAQGEKPAKFFFGDEAWWQATWDQGQGATYLGRLTIDPGTRAASLFMAVGVINPQTNQIIGVLASTYDLGAIQHDISAARTQSTGEVNLLAPDGRVIAGPADQTIGKLAWTSSLVSAVSPTDGAPGAGENPAGSHSQAVVQPDWLLGTDRRGNAAVLAHAPLNTTSRVNLEPLRSLGWQIVVSDSQSNALAKVTRLTKVASLVGLLVMAGVVFVATVTAQVITRPIEALTTTAAAISEGDLEQCAQPVGPVELVTLAEAFNTLTARLRSLINSLQDQVAQRTAQLEARVEELAALNRITQTVASVRDLQAALEIVAREIVELVDTRSTGIALLNEARTELTVMANYSRDDAHPRSVGIVIPILGNPSSSQVVETGRSLVVTQAQTNPLTAPIHHILRERHTQCLMLVPLLTRGEVIGTIGVTTDQAGREFTPAEVRLVETVAGQVAGAVENMRLFVEMEHAKEAAEAANEAKSAFLANVSHELRTPLTSILGFTKIIQKRLQDRIFPNFEATDDKTRRAVSQIEDNIEIIIAEGERLTALINNVLDLAKIEAGKMEWYMQPLAMTEVIDRAIASTAVLFESKGLELIKDVQDGLPTIMGDWDRLVQVVINLISNAVKFTEHGAVTCQARQVDGHIIVSIIDTGPGIAESDRLQVFEKFMQGGDTLTDKPQGTGLGLPICKEIVEYHGGRIWAESVLGQGSSFSFSLPIEDGG
jgi:signal transduction histidine kinase/HAMP domain-containing protein